MGGINCPFFARARHLFKQEIFIWVLTNKSKGIIIKSSKERGIKT